MLMLMMMMIMVLLNNGDDDDDDKGGARQGKVGRKGQLGIPASPGFSALLPSIRPLISFLKGLPSTSSASSSSSS